MNKLFLFTAAVLFMTVSVRAQESHKASSEEGRTPTAESSGSPIMDALDTNRDGKLSAEEIQSAYTALKQLDQDQDEKLSSREIGWKPVRGNMIGQVLGIFFGEPERERASPNAGPPGGFMGFGSSSNKRPRRPDPTASLEAIRKAFDIK